MKMTLAMTVTLPSGRDIVFEDVPWTKPAEIRRDGVTVTIGAGFPVPVTVTPPAGDLPVRHIEYRLVTDLRNYHRPIVPDSGRWFVFQMQMVNFWRHKSESAINDVKTPLYIFTGQDQFAALAFGIVGRNYETEFRILEPRHNRALITYMRRLSVAIRRGTALYPIPATVSRAAPNGAITEHLYLRPAGELAGQPWMLVLRDFAAHQKRIYGIPDVTTPAALAPLWCSWTDWMSNDVTDAVVMQNVRKGLALGIRNYIVDDGWFGPGLDNENDVALNIGDWEPEPSRFPDMAGLVRRIRAAGALPMIWCAPHAVAAGARCFEARKPYLIVGEDGQPVTTSNHFHSLCFMCPDARRIMADIAGKLIEKWDFDGVKYDLFNCVPGGRCHNPAHRHDTDSMVEGLEWTLRDMYERTRRLKPDYVIELKQNYGTPFLARYGTMTRAGDTPYSLEANFLRTLHVQAYSPYAINDYQTITNDDSPEDAACVVLKMMAAGIPTYSIDLDRLCEANLRVIGHYNAWYNAHIDAFMRGRIPLDGEHNLFRIDDGHRDIFFVVNNGGPFETPRNAVIFNGTYQRNLFVHAAQPRTVEVLLTDCQGNPVHQQRQDLNGWTRLETVPGGMLTVTDV